MATKKIMFFILIALIALVWFWYYAIRIDKKRAIQIILKNSPGASEAKLAEMGEDYLIERAKAFRIKKETFELEGKTYITETGKAK